MTKMQTQRKGAEKRGRHKNTKRDGGFYLIVVIFGRFFAPFAGRIANAHVKNCHKIMKIYAKLCPAQKLGKGRGVRKGFSQAPQPTWRRL